MAEDIDWSEYYSASMSKPLHPMYAELDKYLPPSGLAIEIGCGVGHGVLHLLQKGLRVIGVDAQEEALKILASRLPKDAPVQLIRTRLEEYVPPPCDLAVAGFSLFFLAKRDFDAFWQSLSHSIRPGGILMGELLGPRDEWADRGYSVHDSSDVDTLMNPYEILYREEVERDGFTAQGRPKHWHVHHLVARRRA